MSWTQSHTRAPLVVLGATGGIGRGVVQAAVDQERPVIAVGRRSRELKALKAAYPEADLTIVVGSVASDSEGAKLARALRKLDRPFAGVVAAVCGGTERGRLLDHPAAFLRRKLDEDLLPHLAAARHLLPVLAEADRGGTYVLIGGPGSEHPWAGYGHRSIGEAALRMLARVLHDEARTMAVRVQLLTVETPVVTERNRGHACPEWPSALAIGQRALALVEHGASNEPTQAIVRYAARAQPKPFPPGALLRGPGKEAPAPAVPAAPSSPKPASPTPASTSLRPANPYACSQDPDSGGDSKTQRCLQDARALLQALTPLNNKQEPSR